MKFWSLPKPPLEPVDPELSNITITKPAQDGVTLRFPDGSQVLLKRDAGKWTIVEQS